MHTLTVIIEYRAPGWQLPLRTSATALRPGFTDGRRIVAALHMDQAPLAKFPVLALRTKTAAAHFALSRIQSKDEEIAFAADVPVVVDLLEGDASSAWSTAVVNGIRAAEQDADFLGGDVGGAPNNNDIINVEYRAVGWANARCITINALLDRPGCTTGRDLVEALFVDQAPLDDFPVVAVYNRFSSGLMGYATVESEDSVIPCANHEVKVELHRSGATFAWSMATVDDLRGLAQARALREAAPAAALLKPRDVTEAVNAVCGQGSAPHVRAWFEVFFTRFTVDGWNKQCNNMLLHGPPGTGKSTIMRLAIQQLCDLGAANEAQGPRAVLRPRFLFRKEASALVNKYVGESEKAVRRLGEIAGAEPNRLILVGLEEVHTVAQRQDRGGGAGNASRGGGSDAGASAAVASGMITALLQVMEEHKNLVILFSTNFVDALDHAFSRCGRIAFSVLVPVLSFNARRSLVRAMGWAQAFGEKEDDMAALTANFSRAQMHALDELAKLHGPLTVVRGARNNAVAPDDGQSVLKDVVMLQSFVSCLKHVGDREEETKVVALANASGRALFGAPAATLDLHSPSAVVTQSATRLGNARAMETLMDYLTTNTSKALADRDGTPGLVTSKVLAHKSSSAASSASTRSNTSTTPPSAPGTTSTRTVTPTPKPSLPTPATASPRKPDVARRALWGQRALLTAQLELVKVDYATGQPLAATFATPLKEFASAGFAALPTAIIAKLCMAARPSAVFVIGSEFHANNAGSNAWPALRRVLDQTAVLADCVVVIHWEQAIGLQCASLARGRTGSYTPTRSATFGTSYQQGTTDAGAHTGNVSLTMGLNPGITAGYSYTSTHSLNFNESTSADQTTGVTASLSDEFSNSLEVSDKLALEALRKFVAELAARALLAQALDHGSSHCPFVLEVFESADVEVHAALRDYVGVWGSARKNIRTAIESGLAAVSV